jgi:hypothetical protein
VTNKYASNWHVASGNTVSLALSQSLSLSLSLSLSMVKDIATSKEKLVNRPSWDWLLLSARPPVDDVSSADGHDSLLQRTYWITRERERVYKIFTPECGWQWQWQWLPGQCMLSYFGVLDNACFRGLLHGQCTIYTIYTIYIRTFHFERMWIGEGTHYIIIPGKPPSITANNGFYLRRIIAGRPPRYDWPWKT